MVKQIHNKHNATTGTFTSADACHAIYPILRTLVPLLDWNTSERKSDSELDLLLSTEMQEDNAI